MIYAELLESTLAVTGFQETGTVLVKDFVIPFTNCGMEFPSTIGVALLDRNSMILLVGRAGQPGDTVEPPVIADAIAAFQHNNARRAEFGLPPLDLMNIPCITMVGTHPAFYKVPVTRALNDAVLAGQYPENPTNVVSFAPPAEDGLVSALRYFVAFRHTAKEAWKNFLSGFPNTSSASV